MTNIYIKSILNGLDTEILSQLQPELPILQGNILTLSTYGKSMWSDGLSWASYGLSANFVREQDSPFTPSQYGTVQIIEQPVPNYVPIYTHACKVSFNHVYFKKAQENGTFLDLYREQLTAKIVAWDYLCAETLLYGNQETRQNGLLQGSGIPMITSSVNMSTAAPEAVITEFIRIASFTTNATRNIFKPNLIGVPQALYNILSVRPYSNQDHTSILQVIMDRLKTTAGYEKPGDPVFQITSTHQFDDNKIMTVLPSDPNLIGGAIWPLEPFDSNNNTESYKSGDQMLASSHEGGTAGIIAKRPTSGLIANVTY